MKEKASKRIAGLESKEAKEEKKEEKAEAKEEKVEAEEVAAEEKERRDLASYVNLLPIQSRQQVLGAIQKLAVAEQTTKAKEAAGKQETAIASALQKMQEFQSRAAKNMNKAHNQMLKILKGMEKKLGKIEKAPQPEIKKQAIQRYPPQTFLAEFNQLRQVHAGIKNEFLQMIKTEISACQTEIREYMIEQNMDVKELNADAMLENATKIKEQIDASLSKKGQVVKQDAATLNALFGGINKKKAATVWKKDYLRQLQLKLARLQQFQAVLDAAG
jgi:hypothetical protein